MAGINKAFNRPSRPNIITNNVNEFSASQSATQISSGGYTYYVYTTPAPGDTYTPSGEWTQGSRTIKGGSVAAGTPFGNADIFVVAGGGAGGGGDGMGHGGGGGAGGVRYFPNVPVPDGTIAVQVGDGGDKTGSYSGTVPQDGTPSFFGATYISYGGGGAASGDRPPPGWGSGRTKAGQGGSGGGAGTMGRPGPPSGPGPQPEWGQEFGQGNTPPFSPPQGFPGAGGFTDSPTTLGGGGGSSQAGGVGSPDIVNAYGGDGGPISQFPAPLIAPAIPGPVVPGWTPVVGPTGLYAGGGGGGRAPGPSPGSFSPGGDGGGGPGGKHPGNAGGSGVDFTGSGGGGGYQGSPGGNGIVIVRKST
jgi:hypothetical protein